MLFDAQDAVLAEQKSIMAQCLEERKSLALERAQVANTRRELEVALQQQADKALQVCTRSVSWHSALKRENPWH